MAGRGMKPLPDDDRPRTAFVRRLRRLHADAGSPTYRQMAGTIGYSQALYSALFNADRLPAPDFLGDVVDGLNGDRDDWLGQLQELEAEEARLEAAAGASDDPQTRIAELTAEVMRLQGLINNPQSILSVARAAVVQADERVAYAEGAELSVRQTLRQLESQLHAVQKSTAVMHDKAKEIIAEAERWAKDQRAAIAYEGEKIRSDAMLDADAYASRKREEADAYVAEARTRAYRVYERSDRIMQDFSSGFSANAEAEVARAREEAAEIIARANLERAHAQSDVIRAADRFKAQARMEVERLIRAVQQRLEKVGEHEEVGLLDALLLDFNIGGSHEGGGLHGRHRRPEISGGSRRELPAISSAAAQAPPQDGR